MRILRRETFCPWHSPEPSNTLTQAFDTSLFTRIHKTALTQIQRNLTHNIFKQRQIHPKWCISYAKVIVKWYLMAQFDTRVAERKRFIVVYPFCNMLSLRKWDASKVKYRQMCFLFQCLEQIYTQTKTVQYSICTKAAHCNDVWCRPELAQPLLFKLACHVAWLATVLRSMPSTHIKRLIHTSNINHLVGGAFPYRTDSKKERFSGT